MKNTLITCLLTITLIYTFSSCEKESPDYTPLLERVLVIGNGDTVLSASSHQFDLIVTNTRTHQIEKKIYLPHIGIYYVPDDDFPSENPKYPIPDSAERANRELNLEKDDQYINKAWCDWLEIAKVQADTVQHIKVSLTENHTDKVRCVSIAVYALNTAGAVIIAQLPARSAEPSTLAVPLKGTADTLTPPATGASPTEHEEPTR